MSQFMHLMYDDLILYVVAAGGLLFILALIADAWWARRRARIMREQARGCRPVRRVPLLRGFLKQYWRRLVPAAIVAVAMALLVWTNEKTGGKRQNSSYTTPLAGAVAYHHGKESSSAPLVEPSLINLVVADLLDRSVLSARTLNYTVNANLLFGDRNSIQTNAAIFTFAGTNNAHSNSGKSH